MGTKMEIGGEAMHFRSRNLWYEAHAALCAKRRPPLAMPPLLEIANVKLATLSHWQHSQPPALRPIKIKISRKSLYNATKFHTLLEVSPQKFQAGLYLTKTYQIVPFTSISRNRTSALRQTLQSRSTPPCNVWTGAYGHAPSAIKNGEGRQADLPRFTLPGFPAY